jgi:YebC/PmpR family DNA-binding regulatory protein
MAGHSKFKNIQHRKNAQDSKRAKIFTKIIREIVTAVKFGPDPEHNPRLRTALSLARSTNIPKDRIDRAIKSSESGDTENYAESRYEGFLAGGIALIVETLTDNKNRTVSSIRAAITKAGGNLGETGSVSYMFDHVFIIEYHASIASANNVFEAAIEANAREIISDDDSHIIYSNVEDSLEILKFLMDKFGDPQESYVGWKPQNLIIVDEIEKAKKIIRLIDTLEDNDDVQRVFSNYQFSNDVIEQLDKEGDD